MFGSADSPAASLALFLTDVPPESRRGRERERTSGEKTMKFRGLSAKSVTQWNSAQWTAGCFRDFSVVFLQKDHRARPPADRAVFGIVGPSWAECVFLFPEVFIRVFLFKIAMNSAISLYFCEN